MAVNGSLCRPVFSNQQTVVFNLVMPLSCAAVSWLASCSVLTVALLLRILVILSNTSCFIKYPWSDIT
ncbi:unnamed protein product [Meloidogyne enterolobii]|uniref:Uncharacterized protein n=1 Tax=Meloidogyne enterolobii TaxID=390850 RepID=A0ACB0ZT63_MELEN